MNEFLVSLFLDDPVKDFRKREALFLIFLMKGAVDIVYSTGFMAEFRGRTKTATHAYT